MGAYFGTPTKNAESGTQEEFNVAYSAWERDQKPEIMFYFSNKTPSLQNIDPNQLAKVRSFKSDIGAKGVYYFEYDTELALRIDLHPHISDAIYAAIQRDNIEKISANAVAQDADLFPSLNRLLSEDPLVAVDELFHSGTAALNLHTKNQNKMTQMVIRLSQKMQSAARILSDPKKHMKQQTKAVKSILTELELYQRGIRDIIPIKNRALVQSMSDVQRAVALIKSNDLRLARPYHELVETLTSVEGSFKELIGELAVINSAFVGWPDDTGDLSTQRKLTMAMHTDLKLYYESAIKMLDRFAQTLRD